MGPPSKARTLNIVSVTRYPVLPPAAKPCPRQWSITPHAVHCDGPGRDKGPERAVRLRLGKKRWSGLYARAPDQQSHYASEHSERRCRGHAEV